MARSKLIRGVVFTGLVVGGVLLAVAMLPNISGSCGQETVAEFPSPSNNRTAIVVVSNCGATTPYATMVFVKNFGESLDLKNDHFFSVKGRNDIQVLWKDSSSFTVIYRKPDMIYRQAIIWRTERIEYKEQ